MITKGQSFNQVIGYAVIDDKDFRAGMVFTPNYVLKKNGKIELIKLSMILDKNYKPIK